MGSEGVELVRRVYLAWEEGDVEELLSLVDPQVRWSPVLRFLEGESAAVGRQELRRWVSADSDYLPQSSARAAALRGSRCSCAGARTARRRQQAGRRRPRRFGGLGMDRRRRTDRGHGGISRGTRGATSDCVAPRPPLSVSFAALSGVRCRASDGRIECRARRDGAARPGPHAVPGAARTGRCRRRRSLRSRASGRGHIP